tara:strand:- start:117 stop:1493 length:1377 start_codon:yes stop_codon:yes gene_type:complete
MICESKNKSNLNSQNLKIKGKNILKGKVKISGAKNSALVLLAASLLTNEKVILNNVPNLSDIEKMKNILKHLGVKLSSNKNNNLIINSNNLHTGDHLPFELVNGLRASFFCIGPLLSMLGEVTLALPGGCKIGKRPIDEHISGLRELGASIEVKDGLVNAKIKQNKKKLVGAKILLSCPSVGATETLIMAATLAEGSTVIENAAREPEIQDLCLMLNKMGAKIKGFGDSIITIDGVDKLKGCEHKVIPDRIEAGTFLIASAATLSNITIGPVIPNHLQSVLDKLKETGSEIYINGNEITIKTKEINAVNIQTAPFPGFPTDLQAPFTALMTIAKGESQISETIYENRMSHLNSLIKMGASIKLDNNTATIKGVDELKGQNLKGSDLRSTAAIIIAALTARDISYIGGLDHLDRGYECFESKLNILGAQITRNFNEQIFFNQSIIDEHICKKSDKSQAA